MGGGRVFKAGTVRLQGGKGLICIFAFEAVQILVYALLHKVGIFDGSQHDGVKHSQQKIETRGYFSKLLWPYRIKCSLEPMFFSSKDRWME